jgi:curved DNA-binding protein CbpA
MPSDPRHTYYGQLMLAENADPEIISTVYRKLAQRYHPDIDPSHEAARRMGEINEAYATLRDPHNRAKYDAWLAARRDRRRNDRLIVQSGDLAHGSAGPPEGPPRGSIVDFGRYQGWTLGQIKHRDPEFLEWLLRAPAGRSYRAEITQMMAARR